MRSLRCAGDGRVEVVEVPDPRPRPGEALVRVEASAVCGSERGSLLRGCPTNSGHEACGVVVDAGASRFRVGDRVGLSAVVGCDKCERCAAGQELHCRRGPALSDGWHAELVAIAASALREVPDGVEPSVGALLTGDALGVPARGLRRAPSKPGDQVLVIGLGPVGLGHVLVRSFTGADVIAIEPAPNRRKLALQVGATTAIPPGRDVSARPQVVIECTGRPECISQAFELVDNGGVVLQSGECHTDVPINPSELFIRREITYTGSWYYATEDYPDMVKLLDGGLPLERLRTHEVNAEDSQPAITDFLAGRTGKVILRWDQAQTFRNGSV